MLSIQTDIKARDTFLIMMNFFDDKHIDDDLIWNLYLRKTTLKCCHLFSFQECNMPHISFLFVHSDIKHNSLLPEIFVYSDIKYTVHCRLPETFVTSIPNRIVCCYKSLLIHHHNKSSSVASDIKHNSSLSVARNLCLHWYQTE